MIDLYTWTTPNGRKVSILLEELGVPYRIKPIDISKGEQFDPAFLAIAPNNRIPAIVDHDTGVHLMETGAIMLYLAQKYDRFTVKGNEYWHMVEWLMWQMGGLGPMLGQVHHFVKYNQGKSAYAEERYLNEAKRLYKVLDTRLEGRDYVAGDGRGDYTIADMAMWPWISRHDWQQIDLADYPNLRAWYQRLRARPAVQAGYHLPKKVNDIPEG
ncbi:glutathione S-transferase family protein [Salipiger sp. 1_MG-2023]|uniref:glutathione S-transferase family protein n=1 Tax=Salipiger sp. 1_MG-2023 TaxID=3062665 RepID=UPI0026E3FCA8|nr:glutathione S-transferase family protein [Salipiger sp. 1_MG-2023]MDO6585207.1 glutathione S-transferase family protein [Salipiger sp. 1_MG-2023]